MENILENKELLYKIFVDLYGNNFSKKDLDYQFNVAIRSKFELMPYAFALKINELYGNNKQTE